MASQTSNPLVSVVIPCYNYGKYLPDAIKSVLDQEADKFRTEIIVVDDGSIDNTAEVARSFGSPIRYIYQQNQGLSAARNTGIRNASGDFLVFLDADDLLGPNVLAAHLKNLGNDPGIDLSICHCYCMNTDTGDSFLWPLKAAHLDMHLCYSNIAPVHAFMIRSETARDVGFFNAERKACEDYDYWLRCAKLGKRFAPALDAFVVYRQHGDSMSGQREHQFLQDVSVRLEIDDLLSSGSGFPEAGNYYGSLAYAAGLFASSIVLENKYPDMALELVSTSAQLLLHGAKSYKDSRTADPHLIRAGRYYALDYYINASHYDSDFSPALNKAKAFIAKSYGTLVSASFEQLKLNRSKAHTQLVGNYDAIRKDLSAYKLPA